MYAEYSRQRVEQVKAVEQAVIDQLFAEWPDVASEANARLILEHCPKPVTLDGLKETVGRLVADEAISVKSAEVLAVEAANAEAATEAERQHLISQISSRLQRQGYTAQSVEGEIRNKFAFMNLEELRADVAKANEEQRLRNLSPKALLQEIKANARPSREPLPERYTAQVLRGLSKEELRKVSERFGFDAVNQRLGVIAAQQPGICWSR
jgi:hypothetical protein